MRAAVVATLATIGGLVHMTPALAAEPAPGNTVEVTCEAVPEQRYSCYLPKAYDAERAWPILYCFSPNANGDSFVQRYRGVCEERGWIVVGSMNSRNGPWAPIKAAIDAMWADTEKRFNLSPNMRYASGFSGGARVSFSVASSHAEWIAGVIAIGAGLPGSEMPRPELATYLTCGETDPNKAELDPLFTRMQSAGNPVQYEVFPGGHVMPPTELMEKAVRWLDDLAPEKRAREFGAVLAEATEEADGGESAAAWLRLVGVMERLPDVDKALLKEAGALRKKLERLPEVKAEAKARKQHAAALAWIEKNAERIEGFASARQQAVKKLRAVATKFPGTAAAEAATARADELAGEGD